MTDHITDKNYPATISKAVDSLILSLQSIEKVRISSMDECDLAGLHFSLGMYIRNSFGLWADNKVLMESCRELSGDKNLHVDDASMFIIKALWEKLREMNHLRVVK